MCAPVSFLRWISGSESPERSESRRRRGIEEEEEEEEEGGGAKRCSAERERESPGKRLEPERASSEGGTRSLWTFKAGDEVRGLAGMEREPSAVGREGGWLFFPRPLPCRKPTCSRNVCA